MAEDRLNLPEAERIFMLRKGHPWRRDRDPITDVLNLDDFRGRARRRLPRALFAYVDGGAGDGVGPIGNRLSFAQWCLIPRVLRGLKGRSALTTLLGQDYSMPVGISPLGASAVLAYNGDIAFVKAMREAGVPFQLSANSITPLEDVIAANPAAWFAAYLPADRAVIDAVLDRVARAKFQTLVVTVDVPVAATREPETRAGYAMPFRLRPRLLADIASSPRWAVSTAIRTALRRGIPYIENISGSRGPHIFTQDVGQIGGAEQFSWDDVRHVRERWTGNLLLKGILSAEDAQEAARAGADGIIVSNHGARLSECMIAPLDALPDVRAACPDMTILLDGGVRRTGDVLKAMALGADCVFVGRPFLFAAAVYGLRGVRHALRLMARELDREMALLGLLTPREVREGRLRRRSVSLTTQSEYVPATVVHRR